MTYQLPGMDGNVWNPDEQGRLFAQAKLWKQMPFSEYQAIPAINASALKGVGGVSPRHLHAYLQGKIKDEDTPDKRFGRAIHASILEPEQFDVMFPTAGTCGGVIKSGANEGQKCGCSAVWRSPVAIHPEDQRAQVMHCFTAAGYECVKESDSGSLYFRRNSTEVRVSDHAPNQKTANWLDQVRGVDIRIGATTNPASLWPQMRPMVGDIEPLKFWYCGSHKPDGSEEVMDLVTADQRHQLDGIKQSLKTCKANEFLRGPAFHEAVICWNQCGFDLKTRIDRFAILEDRIIVIDFKKMRVGRGSDRECQNECLSRNYHIQAWFHFSAMRARFGKSLPIELYFLFVEENEPFGTNLHQVSDNDLFIADRDVVQKFSIYRRCLGGQLDWFDYQMVINPDKKGILPPGYVHSKMLALQS